MSREVSPLNTHANSAEKKASRRMPLEKTSRSPTFMNCCGRKRSRAIRPAGRGKSANEVFAASTRIAAVDVCTRLVGPSHTRVSEDGAGELRDDRLFLTRLDLVQVGQPAGAQKHDREQERHPQQRRGGVL